MRNRLVRLFCLLGFAPFGLAPQALACDISVASCVAIELAGQSPKLMKEIATKLNSGTKPRKISDIACSGVRLGRHFVHLGGARIVPYECIVGPARLELHGIADFYDDQGNSGAGPKEAMYVFQHSPSWSWK